MALLGSILDPIIPETEVTIEGEGLDTVTDVTIHSESGSTSVDQPIVDQTETSLTIHTELGGLPFGNGSSLDLTDADGSDVTQPITIEPPENQTVVDITETPETGNITAPMGITLEQGDQVRYVGESGEVLPDGTLSADGPVYVQVWDASTETWTDPMLVEANGSGDAEQASISVTGTIQRHNSLERDTP